MKILYERTCGARVSDDLSICGMAAVVLENEVIRVTVLTTKGTDVVEFLDKRTGVDVLWRRPVALRSFGREPHLGDPSQLFSGFYFGGWQELFPTASAYGTYYDGEQPEHGEVTHLPWRQAIVEDTADRVSVRFRVSTVLSPFRMTKVLSLDATSPVLHIEETVENLSDQEIRFMWGHHPAFGAPFLEPGCRIELPRYDELLEGDISRLTIAEPGTKGSDMLYVLGLESGWYGIRNDRLGLGFGMRFDHRFFPLLWIWQHYGVPAGVPLWGRGFACAIEPFTSLPQQVYADRSPMPKIGPHETIHQRLTAFTYMDLGEQVE